jgi:hypothetical protein
MGRESKRRTHLKLIVVVCFIWEGEFLLTVHLKKFFQ